MIQFNNVSKVYPFSENYALKDINFEIQEGEFVSIVGHSGAGKTTIIKLLLAEDKPTKGSVVFDGYDVPDLRGKEIIEHRRRIGVVFQDFRLLTGKTAYENIAFAMEVAGKTDEEIEEDVPHVLGLVDLTDKMHNFPHQMSGGEKQRLAIARAIINQPEVVVADEPTGNLDPVNSYEVVQILKKINDLGTTVILASHDKDVVNEIGKRVITLEAGKITKDVEKGKYTI